jgi:hypothetical protein
MIPLPKTLSPSAPDLSDSIARIPSALGVYVLTPESGDPYLGWSSYLSKRLARLLLGSRTADSNLFAKLRARLVRVEYWPTGSRLETSLLLYRLARSLDPAHYRRRLKLKSPWLVEFLIDDPFPRLSVQNKLITPDALSYGPFPSRDAADRFMAGVEGLFQIRRCPDRLSPHFDHPGCIYGEMNQCMRPCQLAVTEAEYAAEVTRVAQFLDSNGRHMIGTLISARERASDEMQFEQAARIHRELERVKAVNSFRDSAITEIGHLNGVAITPGRPPRSVSVWPMLSGYWQVPLLIEFTEHEAEAKSLDRQMKGRLAEHLSAPVREGDAFEQISLLARWYYSTWCDGIWLPFQTLESLDYRMLVRRVSTVIRQQEERA